MIRLVLLLGAGLFAAMLIGGQDRGQLRFGLMPANQPPVAQPPVQDVSANQTADAATPVNPVKPTPAPVEQVSFAPAEPVMSASPPAADTAEAPTEFAPEPAPDAAKIMFIAAKSVNVREGPGKDFGVVSRLARGEAVLVVSAAEGPEGWSLVRIEGDGVEGYVASRLLTD